MITELAIISFLVSVVFTVGGARRLGELPGSVSTSVFTMPRKRRWLWTAMLWLSTYTMTPALFGVMPLDCHPAAHAFATSVLIAGVFPLVKRSISMGFCVMVTAAWLFSQVCVTMLCPWLLLVWPSVALFLFAMYVMEEDLPAYLQGKGVFIGESVCYLTLFTSIMTKLI